MDLNLEPLTAYSMDELCRLQNAAFEGYVVSIHIDPSLFAGMVRTSGIDLAASRLARIDEHPAAIALIARRGRLARLAGMAVLPSYREKGIGRQLLSGLLSDAKERGERAMVLEALEQNEAALRLYEGAGFQTGRRLVGYRADGTIGSEDDALAEADPFEVIREGAAHEDPELPWQLAAAGQIWLGKPNIAFQLGPARAVISDPSGSAVALRYLFVPHSSRNQGHAAKLLRALFAAFPDKSWRIPPIVPEGLAHGLLTRLGFKLEALAQVEMRLTFPQGGNSGAGPSA